ncbi:hypothetical protein EV182_008097, partial [Spiromyces aspiralis]
LRLSRNEDDYYFFAAQGGGSAAGQPAGRMGGGYYYPHQQGVPLYPGGDGRPLPPIGLDDALGGSGMWGFQALLLALSLVN